MARPGPPAGEAPRVRRPSTSGRLRARPVLRAGAGLAPADGAAGRGTAVRSAAAVRGTAAVRRAHVLCRAVALRFAAGRCIGAALERLRRPCTSVPGPGAGRVRESADRRPGYGYQPAPPSGYGYQPPPPGYGYPPVSPPGYGRAAGWTSGGWPGFMPAYASWGRRVAAFLIDSLVVGFVPFVLVVISAVYFTEAVGYDATATS